MSEKRFKVALSFPGEHRNYVLQVAECLAETLGRDAILYDEWYKAELARPNLDDYLQGLYHNEAGLIVPFLCSEYEEKDWCQLEWRTIKNLIKRRSYEDIMPLRFDDTHISGLFDIDGYIDLNDHQPDEIAEFILQRVKLNESQRVDKQSGTPTAQTTTPKQSHTPAVHIDQLPTVAGEFFGRQAELELLDNALQALIDGCTENTTRIIQFIAAGGTGKTKLLRHWLNQHTEIETCIVWSFYSQGATEDKQVSATPFFTDAFRALGAGKNNFNTEEEKGDYLAELLVRHECLLVLDGLEPLQHIGHGMDGRLKDRAIRRLLQNLSRHHRSLCIITTRIQVHDISDRTHVISHSLDNLTINDGVALLQSLGVNGPEEELRKAVQEYGRHALALYLLGNAITTYLDGDIRKRDTLDELIDDYDDTGQHAFKVMRAYQYWLCGEDGKATTELRLLYLLGLFDHPIETEVLTALWVAQIPGLTDDIPVKAWKIAQRNLHQKHNLLSAHEARPELLDCHPLIREYFGRQLRQQQPESWRLAHECLYKHYKALPQKELPDTLEDMRPLFYAIAHGCKAGLHKQSLEEIYLPRMRQLSGQNYLTQTLGGFSDDLATLSHFFTIPWKKPLKSFDTHSQAGVLELAGSSLQAHGRLKEALKAFQDCRSIYVKQNRWIDAAHASSSMSELQLTLGHVGTAIDLGRDSISYRVKTQKPFQQMICYTTYAEAVHQSGDRAGALKLFQKAERLHKQDEPEYPLLYSYWGFRYCELLLDVGKIAEVNKRCRKWLEWRKITGPLLAKALEQLIIGRSYAQTRQFQKAKKWLDKAVNSLRSAGQTDDLPRGLLAQAANFREIGNYKHAHTNLQEVLEIAEHSGMRLYLTDYHLEMVRLLLTEGTDTSTNEDGETLSINHHLNEAERLINETGYHRRDAELAALKTTLNASPQPSINSD